MPNIPTGTCWASLRSPGGAYFWQPNLQELLGKQNSQIALKLVISYLSCGGILWLSVWINLGPGNDRGFGLQKAGASGERGST